MTQKKKAIFRDFSEKSIWESYTCYKGWKCALIRNRWSRGESEVQHYSLKGGVTLREGIRHKMLEETDWRDSFTQQQGR